MIKKSKPNNFEEPPTDEEDDTLRSNFVFYGIDNTVFFLKIFKPQVWSKMKDLEGLDIKIPIKTMRILMMRLKMMKATLY